MVAARLFSVVIGVSVYSLPPEAARDDDHAKLAIKAFRRFDKGPHPAGLNYGDCFSYALAKATGEPLLFKGDDFSQPEIKRAVWPRLSAKS